MITSLVVGYLLIPGSIVMPATLVVFLWRKYGKRIH
jgi:hypothetical protein